MRKLITILSVSAGLLGLSASSAFAHQTTHHAHAAKCKVGHRGHKTSRSCHAPRRTIHHSGLVVAAKAPSTSKSQVQAPGPHALPAVNCDLYASPAGSDTASGSLVAPFATVGQLETSLSPGQTGCLDSGTYGGLKTYTDLTASGTHGSPITLAPAPADTTTPVIAGYTVLDGSYLTLSGLNINASNTAYAASNFGSNQNASCASDGPGSNGLEVEGANDTIIHDNVYQVNHPPVDQSGNAIGVDFNHSPGGGDNTVIAFDTIHNVGNCDFYDHLIYLAGGNHVHIYNNWMWNDSHGWGIKLDPGPQNANIHGNVIDGAGSGFAFGNSSGTTPTAGNQVFDNIVVNSVGVDNPDIHWSHPGVLVTSPSLLPASLGNDVYGNDYHNNPGGVSELGNVSSAQLSVKGNFTTAPQFANAATHDYALVNGSLPQMTGMVRQ
jgi:hypothetical protein